jgi:uncharacterized protein YbaR (Trm112 family)
MIDVEILKILRCPDDRQELRVAETPLIERLNQKIQSGEVQNRGGQPVKEKIDGGLVRADGKFLYPIRGNLPVMLVDEAIPLID